MTNNINNNNNNNHNKISEEDGLISKQTHNRIQNLITMDLEMTMEWILILIDGFYMNLYLNDIYIYIYIHKYKKV